MMLNYQYKSNWQVLTIDNAFIPSGCWQVIKVLVSLVLCAYNKQPRNVLFSL